MFARLLHDSYVWVRRELTPAQQARLEKLFALADQARQESEESGQKMPIVHRGVSAQF